ncbi:hypothetical protein ACFLZX_01680 [Nanoarchaeota archaeon]
MLKSKKGQFFNFIIVVGALIVLLLTFASIADIYSDFSDHPIGENQLDLVSTFGESEVIKFYIKESAEKASGVAVKELALKGGLYSEPCGSYFGYNVWSEKCVPNAENEFSGIMNNKLEKYFRSYPIPLPPVGYRYMISENELLGLSQNTLTINILDYGSRTRSSLSDLAGEGTLIPGVGDIGDVEGYIKPPPSDKYSYQKCDAFDSYTCEECFWTPENAFRKMASINTGQIHFIEFKVANTNVMNESLAKVLILTLGEWNRQNGDKIFISSICTDRHSEQSWHNKGKAADISRLIDSEGKTHYFTAHDDPLIKAFSKYMYETYSWREFFDPWHCKRSWEDHTVTTATGTEMGPNCPQKIVNSHQNHLHISIW